MPLASIIGYLIRRVQQVHNAYWARTFEATLTSPQYAVLTALSRNPGIDQQTLGLLASLDRSSVAGVVGRLASRAWLERYRDAGDGRRYVLYLSQSAKDALARLTPKVDEVQQRLMEPLNGRDTQATIDRLRQLARMNQPADTSGVADGNVEVLGFDAPGHLVRRSQQIHTSIWSDEFHGEITGPQYAAMHVLSHEPRLNQNRLGEIAALDKSTLADIMGRLEARGWLSRETDSGDGRSRLVALTSAGRQAVAVTSPRVAQVQRALLQPLADPDRGELIYEMGLLAFRKES
jgi:DNA-binding MarR family transcriptional regulator